MRDTNATVNSLLESLQVTDEELELHKELIEKCRENERKITEYSTSTRQNIEKISLTLIGMYQMMTVLMEAFNYLTAEAEQLSLRMMSADRFYRE